MKLSDVKWGKTYTYDPHLWTHAYFTGGGHRASCISKSAQGFYRINAGRRDQYDYTVLEFVCWLGDKHQVTQSDNPV